MKFEVSVVCLLLTAAIVEAQVTYFPKTHDLCDVWARDDNECQDNPTYMWSGCLGSCQQFARDSDDRCNDWANSGECTNNAAYIHVHCPRACQMALLWNPWARNALNIPDAPISQEAADAAAVEPCGGLAVDAYSAAQIMYTRILRYMSGEYQNAVGFSKSAPSEFLGLVGISEAILYALRLYEVVILGGERAGQHFESPTIAVINDIRKTLGAGWASDPIMMKLPVWTEALEESNRVAHQVLVQRATDNKFQKFDYCRPVGTPNFQLTAQYFLQESFNHKPGTSQQQQQLAIGPVAKALEFSMNDVATLNNGVQMPLMGLGTWQMEGQVCIDAVLRALKTGYRSIDTAQAYRNEKDVGLAIELAMQHKFLRDRQELFLASKLSDPVNAGFEGVQRLVKAQLSDLRTPYLDLYMLHSPLPDRRLQEETWRGLEVMVRAGLIRALGVSNFNREELANLYETATIKPAVVQNKVDPYHVGKQLDNKGDDLVQYARSKGIIVVAYSTLSSYPFSMNPIHDPIIRYIAAKHSFGQQQKSVTRGNRRPAAVPLESVGSDGSVTDAIAAGVLHGATSPAQVLLRWALQKGFAVIPRSSDAGRLAENYAAMKMDPLSAEDMDQIDSLQLLVSSPVSMPVPV